MVKKRKRCEEGEEALPGSASVDAALKSFACNQGLNATRLKTITLAYQTVAADNQWSSALQQTALKCSNALGILQHLVSVYLNYKASKDAGFAPLFQQTYIRQLFNHLGEQPFDSRTRVIPDPDIAAYLQQHPLPQSTKELISQGFHKRGADYLATKMLTAAEQHVESEFENRVKQHIAWQLEKRVAALRHSDYFKDRLEAAAHAVFQAGVVDSDSTAEAKITTFLTRARQVPLSAIWAAPVRQAAQFYRQEVLAPFREQRPGYVADRSRSEKGAYLYFIQSNRCRCLALLAELREEQSQLHTDYSQLTQHLNRVQPRLTAAKTVQAVYNQRAALQAVNVQLPWAVDSAAEQTLSEEQQAEFDAARKAASERRKQIWEEHYQPGFSCRPNTFTLLPVFDLKPAFVQYDADGISALINLTHFEGADRPLKTGRNTRVWWTSMMDFHTKRWQKRAGPVQSDASCANRRKAVVRTGKRHIAGGVRQLWRQAWVLDETEYAANIEDSNCESPLLVNHFTTDGMQVKLTLASRTKGEGNTHQHVPPGTVKMRKKGYQHVTAKFDITKHSQGIFASAKKIPKDLLKCLDAAATAPDVDTCFVSVVGADPGQCAPIAHVRSNLTSTSTAEDYKGSGAHFNNSTYRYQSLRKMQQRFELERRCANTEYAASLDLIAQASLKSTATTELYCNIVYKTLAVRSTEAFTDRRRALRLTMHRAKDKVLSRMARDMFGGDPAAACAARDKKVEAGSVEQSRKHTELRIKMKAKLAKDSAGRDRTWCRVVFFGNGQFGHGKHGSVPRKDLLMKLAERGVVILVDEFRSSKFCCVCGSKLCKTESHRVLRCTRDVQTECSVNYINRDNVGAGNIGSCGVNQLLGLARPKHLCRPNQAEPIAVEDEDEGGLEDM